MPDPEPAAGPADPLPGTAPQHAADLPAAARRALAEAEARRTAAAAAAPPLPAEIGGRAGPEPVRFGDWERKGIAVDF